MRIASDGGRLTLMTGDRTGVDVQTASGGRFGADPQAVYDRWDEFRQWAATADADAARPVELPTLGLPTPSPRQVFAVGANYGDHIGETGREVPKDLALFTKFPSCLTGPFDPVALPSEKVDYEAELVVVIGYRTEHVSAAQAWSRVAGLAVGQDISERILQRTSPRNQYCMAKSMPTFGPVGPFVVTPDELPDPDDLAIRCEVNGEVRQNARTKQLLFPVAEIVARLSQLCILLPGDLIFTGTPSGVGSLRTPPRFLSPGDVIVTEIEGLGRMQNRCVAAAVQLEYRTA
jgi:2-keto-4-pentenoate hydratase/2-oxohepta-3-ene-1,7-dioic acid hydratase in catechol pathway